MRFFIVRHGETLWNREGRFQGWIDTDLSDIGLAQGDKVAAYLSSHSFDAVITSPLKRASVTAEKIAGSSGCSVTEVNGALIEISHGDWEGLTSDEVRAKWPDLLENWHKAPDTVAMPGESGESLGDVQRRCAAAADAIAGRYSGDVCLASHDAVIKVLLCHWLDVPLSSFWRFQIPNCSLTIVELKPNSQPRLNLMGDAHYLADGFDRPEQKGL